MTIKRIIACAVDYMFVFLMLTMLVQIRFLNPKYEEYAEANTKLSELLDKALEEKDISYVESEEYQNLSYELQKSSLAVTIEQLVIYVAYFVGFQLWNKGQTLGKKLVKIKVINNKKNEEVKWYQLLLRTVIAYNIIFQIVLAAIVFIVNKETFFVISNILSRISTVITCAIFFCILLQKDKRGLHDLIANTKVVEE